MTDRHHERAKDVVEEFKQRLSPAARAAITDAQYEDLALLVRAAIADELHDAVETMEETVQRIRTDVERPQLEL